MFTDSEKMRAQEAELKSHTKNPDEDESLVDSNRCNGLELLRLDWSC